MGTLSHWKVSKELCKMSFRTFQSSGKREASVQSLSHVNSLWPNGLQHARLPCPSPTPGACSNSCASSWWYQLVLCHTLLLLPSIFPSIRVFYNKSVLWIRWPKHWSFSFSISPSNEYSGLISFRMDWFVLPVFFYISQGFLLWIGKDDNRNYIQVYKKYVIQKETWWSLK